jgi:mono/diheme cytochrome c family protein
VRPQPALILAAIAVAVVACDNMANQPKRLPYEIPTAKTAEPHWPASPPAGIVARDDEREPVPAPPLTLALLQRGHERFDIVCAPCHGRAGDGRGILVERGFPAPPAFDRDRLRAAPVQHFYDVITNGYGAMFPYADRVIPRDRWAIAAYIRALQASSTAKPTDVPVDKRQKLQ